MDFSFTDEQAMICETAQLFFRENATSERTRAAMAGDGIDRQLWQDYCQELGLGGITISEEHGGAGLGMIELAIIAEAAGAQVAAIPLLGLTAAARAIEYGGSEEQKAEWLPKLANGEVIAAFAADDSLKEDDGKLSGAVRFVPHGGVADLFVFAASENVWLVKSDAPGVTVTTLTTMDQTRPFARVDLSNAQGEKVADPAAALKAANQGQWVYLAAEALGGAQECLERTVAYSKEREQFGRPIGSFQAYKHRLADLMVLIEQARSAAYWAASAVDENGADPDLAVHAAKAYCADTYFKCAADMIQLHGGIGFTWEHDAHLFFKRAKAVQEMACNGRWHRERIATMILGEAA